MAETIHTFIGGMDLDTEKALRNPNTAYIVENFRLVSDTDNTSGTYRNVKGNLLYKEFDEDGTIVGHCLVRNYLVLFICGTTSNIIYRITLDSNDEIVSEKVIYDDSKTEVLESLNFNLNNPIKTIGRYESANIVKVYWTDDLNNVRFINIIDENTTDGEVYNGITNYYMPIDKLEFKSNFLVSNIYDAEVKKGGNLKAGVVQYCIQLYNKYGSETVFSPLTNPIHIVEDIENLASSDRYEGSEIDTYTGKSVELTIRHLIENIGYEGLKVIRVFYDTYLGTPTISLIADIELKKYFDTVTYEEYRIIDSGNSLNEYTSEEITILGNFLFTAKDITTKDDLLLFGNINEEPFDVDFDARVFRFPLSNKTFYIYNDSNNESYEIDDDTNEAWDAQLQYVGEDNDCINELNDLTYDNKTTYYQSRYNCKYQWNSTTVGGSGRNLKYSFVTEDFRLDEGVDNTKTATNTEARTIKVSSTDTYHLDNYSYLNYASPYMSNTFRGYQRGEIYRFGIVFYDKKGRTSKVKWIGDIRFPSFKETDGGSLCERTIANDSVMSSALGIRFNIRNIPTEAVAYSIVRMERTDINKTIISQGILSNTTYNSGLDGGTTYVPHFPVLKADGTTGAGTGAGYNESLQTETLVYMSPDINYGSLDYKSGDYFETVGYYSDYGTYAHDDDEKNQDNVIKYLDFTFSSSYNLIYPDKVVYTTPVEPHEEYEVNGVDIQGFVYHDVSVGDTQERAILGSCALFNYTGTIVVTGSSYAFSPTIVNLRRLNVGQYGGNKYENRFGNEYISCGIVVNSTDDAFNTDSSYTTDYIKVFGGDIFITMYERLHGMYYAEDYQASRIVYAPLESKYNLALNSGYTYSRNLNTDDDIFLIRENAGTHSDTTIYILRQDRDFYVYNTVYSNDNILIKYYSESNLDNNITEYDTRVIVSNKKINNEIIDSWTKFGVNNFIDVDTTYGELNNLVNFKNKIFYFQDLGFGVLSINDRSIITDSSSASGIVLGTGGILDRYDYISTYYGNTNVLGVLANESGIYWIDNNKSEMVLFNGEQVLPLSKMKKVDSYFKGIYGDIVNVICTYFPKYNEVWFTITTSTETKTIVFSELFNCYSSFYTYISNIPMRYIPLRSKLLSKTAYNPEVLYEEDAGEYGTLYWDGFDDGSKDISKAIIYIIHTEGYPRIKVYDNIEYSSTSKDVNGTNIFEDTFVKLEVYNDYQNTGNYDIHKYPATGNQIELQRRERKWTLNIPRNSVNKDVSDNENIMDLSNLDYTQTYKDRIRDSYSIFKFTYDTYLNRSFSVPYIIIKYRISPR
jgi:hypothetical protein